MCDFYNFGLIFAGQMHCLPQRLKSTLFEIFLNGGCPKGTRSVEKISNNVDFSLWGNCATTWEYFLTFSSENKIMKIRHSAMRKKLNYLPMQVDKLQCIDRSKLPLWYKPKRSGWFVLWAKISVLSMDKCGHDNIGSRFWK